MEKCSWGLEKTLKSLGFSFGFAVGEPWYGLQTAAGILLKILHNSLTGLLSTSMVQITKLHWSVQEDFSLPYSLCLGSV